MAFHPRFTTRRVDGFPWNRDEHEYCQPGVIIVHATIDTVKNHLENLQSNRDVLYEEYIEPLDEQIKRLSTAQQRPNSKLLTPGA